MSTLLMFATGWIVVGARDVTQKETYSSFEDVVVEDDIVFQSSAVSPIHCAVLCQRHGACEAFTFEGEVCSGRRVVWTSNTTVQSAVGARFFVQEIGGSCANYTKLDDVRRDVNSGYHNLCDDDLIPGWHRFLLNGSNAVMPTECVTMTHCGTVIPYRLDLQGAELPAVGQETAARALGAYQGACDIRPEPVTVRNCGAFYLYKLEPTIACDTGYCAKRMST
ncbi:hypothetical protein V1264_010976 [Littorina saxatilis]